MLLHSSSLDKLAELELGASPSSSTHLRGRDAVHVDIRSLSLQPHGESMGTSMTVQCSALGKTGHSYSCSRSPAKPSSSSHLRGRDAVPADMRSLSLQPRGEMSSKPLQKCAQASHSRSAAAAATAAAKCVAGMRCM